MKERKTKELDTMEHKRRRESIDEKDGTMEKPWGERRRSKKLRYNVILEDWGEEESGERRRG